MSAGPLRALLVDFGGVLTTSVFESFRAFCIGENLDPQVIKRLFRENLAALAAVRAIEKGDLTDPAFAA